MPICSHKTSKRQLSISCKCSEEENDSMISLLEAQCCKRGDPNYISSRKAEVPRDDVSGQNKQPYHFPSVDHGSQVMHSSLDILSRPSAHLLSGPTCTYCAKTPQGQLAHAPFFQEVGRVLEIHYLLRGFAAINVT